MGKLEGRVALVTGAGRGQGRAHAIRLAQEGADVVAVDLAAPAFPWSAYPMAGPGDLADTARLVKSEGRRVLALPVDVRDRAGMAAAVAEAEASLGVIDIVVANAGISPFGPKSWEITEEQWNDVLGVNLTGVWNTTSVVIPSMIRQGRGGSIVVTSSGAGLRAVPNLSDYCATKWGVIGFAKSLAQEVARYDIRVNVVAPGTVDTPMVQHEAMYRLFRPDLPNPGREDAGDLLRQRVSLMSEPWVEAVDVANAATWLATDDARFLTGVVLPVDLGVSIR